MRLRQLLSIVLVFALSGMIATAATSELKNVSVASQGKSTTVTLITTGAFGHNEYRASENLVLVDLTGVSAGKLKDRERSLESAGVKSYHVVSYKGIGGIDVARLELRVSPDATVTTSEVAGGLQVTITGGSEAPSPMSKPEIAATTEAKTTSAPAASSAVTAKIRSVSVVRGKAEMAVEVSGDVPLTAKVLKLSSPDRLVMDIPNSAPGHTPAVAVNSGNIKGIRTSRYQLDPPVTRVVVDLLAPQDYELSAAGNKLLLKLRPVAAATRTPAAEPEASAPVASAAAMAPAVSAGNEAEKQESKGGAEASLEAKPVVFVEPKYQTKQENGDPATAADRKATTPPSAPAQMARMQDAPTVAQQPATAPAPQRSMTPTAASLAAGAQSNEPPKYTGEPIDVNLKDVDVKDFFRLIHEISGLNVVLDPGVAGSLTLVLSDVPWDQALDIVLKNNSFDKQLQGNVLRISTVDNLRKEAQAKRLQLEAESLAVPKVSITRFLSYARAKDVMPTVKKLLSARGDIVADDRMNALVIQDIPDVVPDIDRLIAQLDRKTQEVDIEARVVAATRSFKRELGAMVAVGFGNGPTAVGGGITNSSSSTGGGTLGLTSSPLGGSASAPKYMLDATNTKIQSIPVISSFLPKSPTSGISLLNETNSYRLDVILAAAESRGLLKILSRPHVVTQNNIQAVVKQGMRIPIVTASQLSGPATVQYVEAVLRLTVTPQITIDNTIFLNIDIENTQPDFGTTIFNNPVFMTQQTTTQVLVTDGGTVMIGGVIQTQNSVNTEQVPFLGNVPVLGNLFKKKSVDNTTQELIFIITPKIVQT